MTDFCDYYGVLGIPSTADAARVRSRYRVLAKRYHPDTAKGDKAEAAVKFRLIQIAYEILGDADRRARYDEQWRRHIRSTADHRTNRSQVGKQDKEPKGWKRACRDNPELEGLSDHLAAFSPILARHFRELILDSKDFAQAPAVAIRLKTEFFARYLDNAPQLLTFPDWVRQPR